MRLIDADAFRAIMYQKCMVEDSEDQRWDCGCWIRYRLFEKTLEDAPAVEVEPVRHGKWIEEPYSGGTYWECSVCGYAWDLNAGAPSDNHMNYCPNCGARMEA